jgi:hypothetical protein
MLWIMSNLKFRKSAYGVVALSAWTGFGLSVIIETFGLVEQKLYDPPIPQSQFGYFGNYASGLAGAPERLIDLFSYFTIWSQIIVGIVATLLFLNPNRDGKLFRIAFLDAVLMITVTGVVYNLLLGPNYPPQGLNQISSPIEHTWTPILMVAAFLLTGPRGWIKASIIPKVLVLPIIYVIYTLARGAVIDSYPYDFFDVVSYGYSYVITFVGAILAASLIVLSVYWLIDSRFTKR